MGASIGFALPTALGAAIAARDRRVIALVGDGSAMYTPQALWTMARECLDVTIIIFANRTYEILLGEFHRMGIGEIGPVARNMLEIARPTLDWASLAKAHGVAAGVANDVDELAVQFRRGLNSQGPYLIQVNL
jgi:acetolactate synthase-1/2/3 large subunit